jgi:hypothetical protein
MITKGSVEVLEETPRPDGTVTSKVYVLYKPWLIQSDESTGRCRSAKFVHTVVTQHTTG